MTSISLVVPVFNEEERADEAVTPLLTYINAKPEGSELLIVDDGSTDRTIDVLRARLDDEGTDRVTVVPRPHAGKGATVRAGLLRSTGDVAAFCDVDLATPLRELDRIIAVAASRQCMAIGSRAVDGANLTEREGRQREIAGRAFNRLVRTTLCPGIEDTQCGAKAAPTTVWRQVLAYSTQDRFAWDVEVIALALRMGHPVEELGIEWHHDGRSRVNVLRDGVSMVASVAAITRSVRRAARAQRRSGQAPVAGAQEAPAAEVMPTS